MSRKRASQTPIFISYIVTMLICFILFGSAAVVLLDKFVTQPKLEREQQSSSQVTSQVQQEYDYSQHRSTILFVNAEGENIYGITLLRVLPDSLSVKVLPISGATLATVGDNTGTLSSLYEAGGMTYLYKAVENAFGISADRYIKINNSGFNRLCEYLGGTSTYVFPSDIYYKDAETGSVTSFTHGPATRTLWGDDIRKIANYPLYEEGAKDALSVTGELAVCLINSACGTNSSSLISNLQEIFNTIYNNSDTDITSKVFKNSKEAYSYLVEKSTSPATYRLPSGSWNQDYSIFTPSDEFKDELISYFELDE